MKKSRKNCIIYCKSNIRRVSKTLVYSHDKRKDVNMRTEKTGYQSVKKDLRFFFRGIRDARIDGDEDGCKSELITFLGSLHDIEHINRGELLVDVTNLENAIAALLFNDYDDLLFSPWDEWEWYDKAVQKLCSHVGVLAHAERRREKKELLRRSVH